MRDERKDVVQASFLHAKSSGLFLFLFFKKMAWLEK